MESKHGELERCIGEPCSVSLEAEVPELLFDGMRAFLEANPRWDQYSLITTALASFLFQNGCSDRCVTEHYLDGLFSQSLTKKERRCQPPPWSPLPDP